MQTKHFLGGAAIALLVFSMSSVFLATPVSAGEYTGYWAIDNANYFVPPWFEPVETYVEGYAYIYGYDPDGDPYTDDFVTQQLYYVDFDFYFRTEHMPFGIGTIQGFVRYYQYTWSVWSNKRGTLYSYNSGDNWGWWNSGDFPSIREWSFPYRWPAPGGVISLWKGEVIRVTVTAHIMGHVHPYWPFLEGDFDWYLDCSVYMIGPGSPYY